jgi:hypothetical protein
LLKPVSQIMASEMPSFQAMKRTLARHFEGPGRVARPAAIQVGRQQRIKMQPAQHLFVSLEHSVHDHHRVMRIRDDLLRQGVPLFDIPAHHPDRRRIGVDIFEMGRASPFLLMEKRLPVGDQKPISRIWGRSMVGKYTSLRMPCETVNHTRLDAEYAVLTVSLAADVQRGSRPGAPNAAPEPSIHRYCVS